MFTYEEITALARFDEAAARLTDVINGTVLQNASRAAFDDGFSAVPRTPSGRAGAPGTLVRVHLRAPVRDGVTVTVPMLWESAGKEDDEPYPVLAADLKLADDGDGQVRLTLTGVCRPPTGLTPPMSEADTCRFARTTMRSLLRQAARAISGPVRAGVRDSAQL